MAREDILGGLKSALMRGYSLKDAMVSFYNAGYSKEDIEASARTLQYQMVERPELRELLTDNREKLSVPGNLPEQSQKQGQKPAGNVKESSAKEDGQKHAPSKSDVPLPSSGKERRKFKSLHQFQPKPIPVRARQEKNAQNYRQGTGIRVITLTLVALLVILLGALAAIFIFREQIIQFFNGLLK